MSSSKNIYYNEFALELMNKAKCFYEVASNKDQWCDHQINEIKSLFELNVFVHVYILPNDTSFCLKIFSADFGYYKELFSKYYRFDKTPTRRKKKTLNDYEKFVATVFETIKNLKFNNIVGMFEQEKTPALPLSIILNDLSSVPHISLNCDICCVCHEPTMTKTRCGHYLCIMDRVKLERVSTNITTCPMCRADITRDDDEDGQPIE